MEKRLLTTILSFCALLSLFAQSGWTDPSSEYHSQTVVYARVAIDTENGFVDAKGNVNGEIGVFVGDELRAVKPISEASVGMDESGAEIAIYTFRVGGETGTNDERKSITFKLYDSNTGFIYSLAPSSDNPIWQGDKSVNTPSEYITLSYRPTNYIGLVYKDNYPEMGLTIRVGETLNIWEYMDIQYGSNPDFPTTRPDNVEIKWDINGTYSDYLSIDEEGVLTPFKPTPQSEDTGDYMAITYSGTALQGWSGMDLSFQIKILPPYVAITSISVPTITLYKEQGLYDITEKVVFNNGDSEPTYTDFTLSVETNDVVAVRAPYVIPREIGTATVTITSRDPELGNNQISSTFEVKVISALESITYPEDRIEYTLQEGYEPMDDSILPLEFVWTKNEDGSPVVSYEDESFTVESADSDILEVVQEEGETGLIYRYIAVSKGQTTLTFTSVYDPSKQVVVPVYISKAVHGINIVEVNEEDPFSKPAPMVNVAVGQEVTALAQVYPEDADYSSVVFRFVDANWGILEKTNDDVMMGDVMVADGGATVTFMFNRVPEREYYLQAVVDGISSDIVKINVRQSVSDIKLFNSNGAEMADGDEMSIWYLSEEDIYKFFTEVLPEDATNKSVAVTVEPEGVLSYAQGEIEGAHDFTILSKGTATITFESVDNPSVKKTITVTTKKKVAEMWLDLDEYTIYSDEVAEGRLNIWPADADINYDNFMINVWGEREGWEYLKIEPKFEDSEVGDNGLVIPVSIEPVSLSNNLNIEISYMPEEDYAEDVLMASTEVAVVERIGMAPGWSWISLISGAATVKQLANELVEARSQTELVYNDSQFGLFGELNWFNSSEAYKVNIASMSADGSVIESAKLVVEESNFDSEGEVAAKSLSQGWNWVGYPYEYNYLVSDVFDATQFAEGDLILSKDSGLAALKNGEWENDFELTPNTGYMIYHNGEIVEVTMPNRYLLAQPEDVTPRAMVKSMARKAKSVWNYDGSRFANTMAIIGKLELNDAVEDYTIGAFVGDECRGEGKVVNGTAYITVAGEGGEEVSFRLYNKWTGKYSDVDTKLAFADLAGSVMNPVILKAPNTTGINDVAKGNQSIYLNGNTLILGNYNGVATIMTTDGKVAATTTEASIAVDELPAGVYVVIINDENGRIVKKIAKK